MAQTRTQTTAAGSSVKLTEDTAVARQGTYIFTFRPELPVPAGGSLTLTIPSQIELLTPLEISDTSASLSKSTGESVKANYITFKTAFVAQESPLTFKLRYLLNPKSSEATDSFIFQTFDSFGFAIERLDTGL